MGHVCELDRYRCRSHLYILRKWWARGVLEKLVCRSPTYSQNAACAGQARQVQKVLSGSSIRGEVEDSLHRLGWVFRPVSDPLAAGPGFSTARRGDGPLWPISKREQVRWIWVSNFSVEQLRRAQQIAPVTSLQPRYSLIHCEVEPDVFLTANAKGSGAIVYSPMGWASDWGYDAGANCPVAQMMRSVYAYFNEPESLAQFCAS